MNGWSAVLLCAMTDFSEWARVVIIIKSTDSKADTGSWNYLQFLQREKESKEETSLQLWWSVCETALRTEPQMRGWQT